MSSLSPFLAVFLFIAFFDGGETFFFCWQFWDNQDCKWTWGSCSQTCGGGSQSAVKTRKEGKCGDCNIPSGSRSCNTQCCIANCTWDDWKEWGFCSQPCGGGIQIRERVQNPPASCGGNNCSGPWNETTSCNEHCCAVNCTWGSWTAWTNCSVICGGGTQNRSRVYDPPSFCGGTNCTGSFNESRTCNNHCCPVHCVWGNWSEWSSCTKPCGNGKQESARNISVQASCDGLECSGANIRSRGCNEHCCPVNCVWDSWGPWGACSKTCENGTQNRPREIAVEPSCNGSLCEGGNNESRSCNDICCPIECVWTDWTAWTACSLSCGNGNQSRFREIEIPDFCNGTKCKGKRNQTRNCNELCCPTEEEKSCYTSVICNGEPDWIRLSELRTSYDLPQECKQENICRREVERIDGEFQHQVQKMSKQVIELKQRVADIMAAKMTHALTTTAADGTLTSLPDSTQGKDITTTPDGETSFVTSGVTFTLPDPIIGTDIATAQDGKGLTVTAVNVMSTLPDATLTADPTNGIMETSGTTTEKYASVVAATNPCPDGSNTDTTVSCKSTSSIGLGTTDPVVTLTSTENVNTQESQTPSIKYPLSEEDSTPTNYDDPYTSSEAPTSLVSNP